MLYREHKHLDAVTEHFRSEYGPDLPPELQTLLGALEAQRRGKMGRAREAVRDTPAKKAA
jgi:UDP-N-acetylglucosamine acyltransferase